MSFLSLSPHSRTQARARLKKLPAASTDRRADRSPAAAPTRRARVAPRAWISASWEREGRSDARNRQALPLAAAMQLGRGRRFQSRPTQRCVCVCMCVCVSPRRTTCRGNQVITRVGNKTDRASRRVDGCG
eukprot:364905-Chlamydomonas_euryale.AAC.16